MKYPACGEIAGRDRRQPILHTAKRVPCNFQFGAHCALDIEGGCAGSKVRKLATLLSCCGAARLVTAP